MEPGRGWRYATDVMRRIAFTTMTIENIARERMCLLCLVFMLLLVPAFAADPSASASRAPVGRPAPGDVEAIVSTSPMRLEAEGAGVHGELFVAPEIVSPDTRADLIYTITEEPLYGRVGLAGGDEEDFFNNKTSRLGYFAYQPQPDFE